MAQKCSGDWEVTLFFTDAPTVAVDDGEIAIEDDADGDGKFTGKHDDTKADLEEGVCSHGSKHKIRFKRTDPATGDVYTYAGEITGNALNGVFEIKRNKPAAKPVAAPATAEPDPAEEVKPSAILEASMEEPRTDQPDYRENRSGDDDDEDGEGDGGDDGTWTGSKDGTPPEISFVRVPRWVLRSALRASK